MFKLLWFFIKIIIIIVIAIIVSQVEYNGRKLFTYAKEVPKSIFIKRVKELVTKDEKSYDKILMQDIKKTKITKEEEQELRNIIQKN